MGEKFPEKCSGLFQHLDIVAVAFRHFSGISWFHYDENDRLHWGVRDIGLWLNLLFTKNPNCNIKYPVLQIIIFHKGFCVAFNEGQCTFFSNCRYNKHECS